MPLPKLPDPESVFSVIDKAGDAIESGLNIIDKVASKFDQAAQKFGPPEEKAAPASTLESQEELSQNVASTTQDSVSKGTACLPCSRDHLSVTSSALGEGVRFARDKGVKDPEVLRRLRIALDELNIMERIDLAPPEIVQLKGKEKELANWVLNRSRSLRHDITAITNPDDMEQVAAKSANVTEEFMKRIFELPEEECETCGEVRERLKEFIERRKREKIKA